MKIIIAVLYILFLSVFLLAAASLLREALRRAPGIERKTRGVALQLIGILGLCFMLFFAVHGKVIFGISDSSRISEVQRIYDRRTWNDEIRIHKGAILDRSGEKKNALAFSVREGKRYVRKYPLGEAASHIAGYCDLRRQAAGLEAALNEYLLGKEGKSIASWSNVVVNTFWRDTFIGQDIVTTIDADLQRTAYEKLAGRKGAVVVLAPQTGEVLALVSVPGFNPEEVKNNADWLALIGRKKDAPLFNRALAGRYPPGSIFKVLVAAAALEDGWNGTIACGAGGFTPEGSRRPVLDFEAGRNSGWKGYGEIGMTEAMVKSSNTFFARLGTQLGEYNLRRSAHHFGMNAASRWNTRFPLINYVFVAAPSHFPAKDLNPVDLAWSSIGQGEVLMTPLKAAQIAAAIANNGVMMKPTLELSISPQTEGRIITSAIARRLQEILRKVVKEGTGVRANVPGIEAAGKTGTAEIGDMPPHSWFIGFAPEENAALALAVIVENGGVGGRAAAEVAHSVFLTARRKGYFHELR